MEKGDLTQGTTAGLLPVLEVAANSVSVGSEGATRRITNAAPCGADNDAVTVSQLLDGSHAIDQLLTQANAGTAAALAQDSTLHKASKNGATFAIGSGSYAGKAALSAGGVVRSGRETLALAASIIPGQLNAGIGTGVQWHIGRRPENREAVDLVSKPGHSAITDFDETIPNRQYLCSIKGVRYRIGLSRNVLDTSAWRGNVDALVAVDGSFALWQRVELRADDLPATYGSAIKALNETLASLVAFTHSDR